MDLKHLKFCFRGSRRYPLPPCDFKVIASYDFYFYEDGPLPRNSQMHVINWMGEHRLINIHYSKIESDFFSQVITKYKLSKCINYLQSFLNVYNFEYGYLDYDDKVKLEKKNKHPKSKSSEKKN